MMQIIMLNSIINNLNTKKTYFIILVSILSCISVFSQENNNSEFKPSGKPYAKIFSNFHSGLSENNNNSEFQIARAYLGYLYNLSTNFSTKIVFDIGNPTNSSKYERIAYVKNAYLTYNKNKLSVNFGLIVKIQRFPVLRLLGVKISEIVNSK